MQLEGTGKNSIGARNRASALRFATILSAIFCAATSEAQVKITLSDLFTKTNLYYRAYANRYDPSDVSGGTAYAVPAGLIGDAGPDQFWDFSTGPTNVVL